MMEPDPQCPKPRHIVMLADRWAESRASVMADILGLASALKATGSPTSSRRIAEGLAALANDPTWRSWRHMIETYALARGQGFAHERIIFALAML